MELKDKQLNKKPMSIGKKRLIASLVASAFAVATVGCAWGVASNIADTINIGDEIDDLKIERSALYTEFKTSEEFQKEYLKAYNVCTEAYTNNLLNLDEYSRKLEYINSDEFIESVIASSTNNTDTIKKIAEVNDGITVREKEQSNPGALVSCSVGTVFSFIGTGCSTIYLKDTFKKKEEHEDLTI